MSKASAVWEGALEGGRGTMKPGHVEEVKFGGGTRFGGEDGSNPEELVGAALAGCFSMALAVALSREGAQPQRIETNANVELRKGDDGYSITNIALQSHAKVSGIGDAEFQRIAEATKKSCPVSKALAGTTITLSTKLDQV